MRLSLSLIFCIFFTVIYFHAYGQTQPASCPESAQYYSKDSINVVTFGASTVEGVNGIDFQSYLTGNFTNCYKNKSINIQKYGVGGETTTQSLLRIDNAIRGKTGFIVILAGVNDAVQIDAGRQTLAETEASMRELIKRSLKQSLIPLVSTLQFFDDRNDARLRRVNNQIRSINNLYRKLVEEYGIYLIDINGVIRRDFSLYQDLIHPNARGNRLISFIIFDAINKIIAEKFLQFTVSQNYPNPGSSSSFTSLDIVMPKSDKIELKIYSMQGKLVRSVINEYLNTGKHVIQIQLNLLPPGVYIYKVSSLSGQYSVAKKMIVN